MPFASALSTLFRLRVPLIRAVLLTALAGAVPAGAEVPVFVPIARNEQMLFVDDPAVWTQPRRIVPPTYPAALLEKGVTGFVDVEVGFSKTGRVSRINSIKSTPAEPRFEAAVRDVIDLWTFHEPLTKDCTPEESTGNTRIWFEIKEGAPSISVSNKAWTPAQPARLSPRMKNLREVLGKMVASYPKEARRSGVEAQVYAVLSVDGDTGKTLSVKIAANTAPRDYAVAFNRGVLEVFSGAEFAVGDEHKGATHNVCKPVAFILRS